mgnify:CR=1 FL=1
MKLLNKLTTKSLKLNKKRTIVTIIGIILSVALITAVASMAVSFKESYIKFEKTNRGDYHYAFLDVKAEELADFKNNRAIEKYYLTKQLGYAKIEESKNEDKPYTFIMEMDKQALESLGIKLVEGKMPENSNEIVIPTSLKTNGRVDYKVGDVITLNIGDRVTDGYKLTQKNPYNGEETFEASKTKTYKIVGRVERLSYGIEPYTAPGYTFITLIDNNNSEGIYNVYARYTKNGLKNEYKVTANILGIKEEIYEKTKGGLVVADQNEEKQIKEELEKAKYNIDINKTLIKLETLSFSESTMKALYSTAGVVVAIIIVTSVFCIKNSFDISITEKIKQYGMLASIGATKKQIKKNVYFEALILGLIGIPLGILSGLLATFILIQISNALLKGMMNMELIFSTSTLAILISVLLGSITIYFSARKSAKRAAKTSPISAIRSNEDIKIKAKKVRSPKIINKIFGIGGEISYKNLKRNKKKYRTTVVSIIVCTSVFIALYSFMNLGYRMIEFHYGKQEYNISVYLDEENEDNEEMTKEIASLEDIDRIAIEKSGIYIIKEPKCTEKFVKYEGIENREENGITVISLGKQEYENYLKKLNLKYEDVKDKAILINNSFAQVYDEKNEIFIQEEIDIYTYKAGDTLKGNIVKMDTSEINVAQYIEKDLEIAKTTNIRPLGLENVVGTAYIIVSDENMDNFIPRKSRTIYINSSNPENLQDKIEKIVEGQTYDLFNSAKEEKNMKSMYALIQIFLYGFIIVIALIGITNIFNTITTNMELRSREFAMLKSIGMTKKEFNRMVRLESLFYGTKSLLIGIPIGIGLSYLIYKALTAGLVVIKYEVPVVGILISIIAVFALIFCIMKYSINKINKQNTIETIRNENI